MKEEQKPEHEVQVHQKQNHQPRNPDAIKQRISVTYYTDPLCCWSWAFEQHWQKFLNNFSESISCKYVMAGMIPDWNQYNDPMNSVSRPLQMGPVWQHASEVTHVKMNSMIWFEDPPSSSYPSCIAVKTASLQSEDAGKEMLSELRRTLMINGKNIAKKSVIFDVARDLKTKGFDYARFEEDWIAQRGLDLFREDLRKVRYHQIGRFPTITFAGPDGKGVMITGFRPYEAIVDAFNEAQKIAASSSEMSTSS